MNIVGEFIPRGTKVMLPHGGLPEMVSLYMLDLIKKTGGKDGPLGKQFISRPELERRFYKIKSSDPLVEDHHEVAPGLIYKYKGKISREGKVTCFGRVLWTITRFCATYCRFCTRGREVGIPAYLKPHTKAAIANKPYLDDQQIKQVFEFIKKHPEINEIIVSGGDPLTCPQSYLTKIIDGLANLQKEDNIHIIRVGTRVPVHNPPSIQPWHYQLLAKIRNPYLMVHVNHPAEITDQMVEVIDNFRRIALATVLSQTVLLKGVNDSVETLLQLFYKLTINGIRPYYVFQNDPVYWAAHFTVPIKQAIRIWGKLRPKLSGIAATARLVIDVPFGYGKIPLPEGNAWQVNYKFYRDFKGKKMTLK